MDSAIFARTFVLVSFVLGRLDGGLFVFSSNLFFSIFSVPVEIRTSFFAKLVVVLVDGTLVVGERVVKIVVIFFSNDLAYTSDCDDVVDKLSLGTIKMESDLLS